MWRILLKIYRVIFLYVWHLFYEQRYFDRKTVKYNYLLQATVICMLRTHCSCTGPVILVFNYHVNFLSVTGHDLLNESNTFTLNPKPVALWRLFKPEAIFFFTCCMCYSKRGRAAKRISAACLYRVFNWYFYLRENENKLDGFIILNL